MSNNRLNDPIISNRNFPLSVTMRTSTIGISGRSVPCKKSLWPWKVDTATIIWVSPIASSINTPKYSSLGFYIHSCIKMRYKGAYKPTYILGVSLKPRVSKVDASDIKLTPCPKDPETYEWDPLDSETINRLNIRDYVSLSRERRLGITVSQSTSHVSNLSEDDQDYLHQGQQANDDKNDEMSSPVPRRGPLPQPQSNSLFAVNMPGVMTPSEVSSKIDLKRWKLRIDDSLTVSLGDLAIFYETDITDPDTIKGLAAEFAATLGSELVNGSQIILDWMR